MLRLGTRTGLLCGTALLTLMGSGGLAQPVEDIAANAAAVADCAPSGEALAAGCEPPDLSIPDPILEEDAAGPPEGLGGAGFQITIDGEIAAGDPAVAEITRATDLALEAADIRVSFDSLGARTRLDLQRGDADRALQPGETVTVTSRMNYPDYVSRGEIRVIDRAGRGSAGETLAVIPIDANGPARFRMPEGDQVVVVYRVYDTRGRYDETVDIPLSAADDRDLTDGVEEGTDATARRSIPVRGGAVTVSGENVDPQGTVTTLGETIRPAPEGDFALQRILPVGRHVIEVRVSDPMQDLSYSREIEIPRYDMFYTALTDATVGINDIGGDRDTYTRGRLAFYVKGYTASGIGFTVAADSRDDDLRDLFSSLDEKDPTSLLRRIDPNELYPTYGDGSSIVQDAPTQGKIYVRVEKDDNYAIWGNSRAELDHTEYLRNERVLYGANVHWESQTQTSHGEPRSQITLYAARPDNLPQRDVLRGTGGSVYFLSRQDITRGSEVVSIELRDPQSGRVIDRRYLVAGTDYEVNYLQGSIRLAEPLASSDGGGGVVDDPGNRAEMNLIVQYDYTPIGLSIGGASLGGRVESWVTDALRLGLTAQKDDTGTRDQTAYGADIHYRLGETSYLQAEYARSKGPGHGYRSSTDGGLIYDSTASSGGTGAAFRAKTELSLTELGLKTEGVVSAYYEDRDAGFTSLDYSAPTDERLWGFDADIMASERLSWRAYYEDFRNGMGRRDSEGGGQLVWTPDEVNSLAMGVQHVDRVNPAESGRRTDLALRYSRQVSPAFSWSILGQTTLSRRGLPRNDRIGIGLERDFGNGLTLAGEVSDGTLGAGADIRAEYARENGDSLYFGYEMDPDSFDRTGSFDNLSESRGRFVFGHRRQISGTTTFFGENTYDLTGVRRSLTSSYGVDYSPSPSLTYSFGLDMGEVQDRRSGDFRRHALSLGVRYQDERLTASGRAEYRRERGDDSRPGPANRDADTILLTANATYSINEASTLLAYLDLADTDTDETSIRDGRLTDMVLGYAVRPTNNDRFNMLFKYRYYHDMYGQTVDGTDNRGPRQKSHVFTVDAEYDLNPQWSLGGKLGARLSESSDTATGGFQDNDAWLGVLNARYHVVHNWDILIETRALRLVQARTTDFGVLVAAYRHFGENMKVGLGYNFGNYSDDLIDLTRDDRGLFLNVIAKF